MPHEFCKGSVERKAEATSSTYVSMSHCIRNVTAVRDKRLPSTITVYDLFGYAGRNGTVTFKGCERCANMTFMGGVLVMSEQ